MTTTAARDFGGESVVLSAGIHGLASVVVVVVVVAPLTKRNVLNGHIFGSLPISVAVM